MDAWIQMFGIKCVVDQIPSVIHVLVFSLGMYLILRESEWPDWQKAIMLASAFLITVECVAYRFDDFHVLMDSCIFYSVALLLQLARTDAVRGQLGLAALLGILSGLGITTRPNDGGALLVATLLCLLPLARRRKLVAGSLFLVTAAVTALVVVKLTGDSYSAYVSNSILGAAGAKGGTGSLLTRPFQQLIVAFHTIRGRRWLFLWMVSIAAAGALVQRRWSGRFRYLVALELGLAGVAYAFSSTFHREQLRAGEVLTFSCYSLNLLNYLLVPLIALSYLASKMRIRKKAWDPRELLILIPLAQLASVATSNATKLSFLSPFALLLLLVPAIQPFRRWASWANPSVVTIVALMGLTAMVEKIHAPYNWLYFKSSPMFEDRQWYQHPVYGPMYMERDLLHFIVPICRQIGTRNSKPELLSIPFSYPNYFCDTPPWHGYVQTFFDTVTPSTIHQLMSELDTTPPKWIVYQRQTRWVHYTEVTFHGGHPIAQHALDDMIQHKILTGQWQVVERNQYLYVDKYLYDPDDGWYLIRTRP
jgi:hypothetical protein